MLVHHRYNAYLFIHLFICLFRACRGQTAIELVNTEEMRELLTSPVVKEAKSVTNGSVNQHTLEAAGIHLDKTL